MNRNWRIIRPNSNIGPKEHITYLDKRSAEMSPKEWRQFCAAVALAEPKDMAGMIALTFALNSFEYYFPAGTKAEAGRLLAIHNYGVRGDVLPYLDDEKIYDGYKKEHGAVFVDGAFISKCSQGEMDRITTLAENIRTHGIPDDDGWSAKLLIRGPSGQEAWLRLPDYEEVNGGQADEIATLLHELGADSLDECDLIDAKCFVLEIDLMSYNKPLGSLAFDASNLWFSIEEGEHSTEHFYEKLHNALILENCTQLDHAIDIAINIDCYDFVSDSDLRATAENIMPTKHSRQGVILEAFDYEAYAAAYYRSQGMLEVNGGFFMRNSNEFRYDYSLPLAERQAQDREVALAGRLHNELDRWWGQYKAERIVENPEWVFDRARDIAATEAAYSAFLHGNGLTGDMMERLLQFENPLEILCDAWNRSTDCADAHMAASIVEHILDDPEVGQSYDHLPEFSGRPEQNPRLQLEQRLL